MHDELDAAYDLGFEHGQDGIPPYECPYLLTSMECAAYMEGHNEGLNLEVLEDDDE